MFYDIEIKQSKKYTYEVRPMLQIVKKSVFLSININTLVELNHYIIVQMITFW
jgi:hypothetical protein